MDLIIAGAIIKDDKMIHKAIASVPDYPFSKKYIVFDGCKKEIGKLRIDMYNAYTKYIQKKYPEFIVIRFDDNVYFREMIEAVSKKSEAKRLFVIQDDVIAHPMDLKQIEIQMNHLNDCKILSFPHKYISPEGTSWHEPFDDSYPLPFIKSHGFSERVFVCDRSHILNICETMPKNNKMNKRFIEFIYDTKRNSSKWKRHEINKEEYWDLWGHYFHHDIYHTHQCAKRKC